MSTFAPPTSPPVALRDDDANISRVPYLPGLDGMRALAVVAVMLYHANATWLPGGYLGVEMFFVISGYLITLLIIAERERNYRVSLRQFWLRRARRLLPALFLLLALVTIWTVIFEPGAVGQLRGDVLAAVFYVSNWYQLFVGLGYTAAGDFAPLRHLWSLAVEEQFYLVWPLVMIVLLRRRGSRRVADVSRWLFLAALGVAIVTAMLYHPGVIGEPEQTPEAYWWIGDRPISKFDFSYIGTFSRSAGLMLGAALAMVWRPFAVARGPLGRRPMAFDIAALIALVVFAYMCWEVALVTDDGRANPVLFQGGLFASSILTLFVIAAVAHPAARANRVLGNALFVWIGVRSYGLYLYHWPIYQVIRDVAGNKLRPHEFVLAMVITLIVTELSYRFVETPIRRGTFGASIRRIRANPNPGPRRVLVGGVAAAVALSMFAGATLATAELEQNEIAESLEESEALTVGLADADVDALSDLPDAAVDLVDRVGTVPPGPPTSVRADPFDPVVTTAPPSTASPASPEQPEVPPVPTSTVVPDAPSPPAPTLPPLTPAPTTAAPATSVAPVDTVAPTTVPPPPDTTIPVVPASTLPPLEPPPQLGVVTDLSDVTPLGIPPVTSATAIPVIGLGDSVMLGATEELNARGVVVDAVKSRQFSAFLPELQVIKEKGFLGSVVIVHLGTNGSFPQASLDTMMAMLADVPVVVFVTGKASRGWIEANNEKIRLLPSTYPNVTVLDWEMIGPRCEGGCFYSDDIHLNQRGQDYYANALGTLIGL